MEQADPISLEIERAATLIDLRRFDAAASSLRRVLGQDPENGAGWCLLAQAQIGREDFKAALEAADRAVAVAPESDWAHRVRSIARAETGDHRGAVAAGYEAIKLDPEEWLGYLTVSLALAHVEDRRDEAISIGEHAVRLAPNESDAHVTLADAFAADGKRKEAEAEYRRALALDPSNSAAHNNLAAVKMRKSRYRAARLAHAAAGFQTAIQTNPRDWIARQNLELTLRVFLARLSYLIFIVAYVYWRIPVSSLVIVVLLCAPAVFALRFLLGIGADLRRHLQYAITHGRVGLAAAVELSAILVLLYALVGLPANHGVAAGVVWTLSLAARLILGKEVAAIAGVKLLSGWVLAVGLGVIAFVFGISAIEDSGWQRELDVLVAVASFVGMIYAIRQRRRV